MSDPNNKTYLQIGYNNLLQISDSLAFPLGANDSTADTQSSSSSGQGSSGGSVETMPVKSDGAMGDVWISTFIKSTNWQPKTVGFYIDGKTGYAEFSNVYISGNALIGSGTIGGFTIGATNLSATASGNTTILSSGATAFSAGPTGSPTITIMQSGAATFTNITATGTINATGGYVGSTTALVYEAQGINVGSTGYIRGGQTSYNTGIGFWEGYDNSGTPGYKWSIGNPAGDYMYFDGTNLVLHGSASLVGTLPWSSITNDGNAPANNATVGATWGTNLVGIPDVLGVTGPEGLYLNANYMGYWDGAAWKTYMNNAGDFYLSGTLGYLQWDHGLDTLTIRGNIDASTVDGTTTIGGRLASILAGAIDSVGELITTNLNTSTKTILAGFTFNSTDYAGSLKTGNITWNSTTGAITGGSGIVINKKGIVGASSGVTTFSIDGTTGDATFKGTILAGSVIFMRTKLWWVVERYQFRLQTQKPLIQMQIKHLPIQLQTLLRFKDIQ
jgi:hypothetical protein